MARAWQVILRGLRWSALVCVVGGGLMFVLGALIDFRPLAVTGFVIAAGVCLLVAVVFCGVFAADESRYRSVQDRGDLTRAGGSMPAPASER